MAEILKSYLAGRWVAGEGEGRPLYDPTTEEVLAFSDTTGLDFGGALEFARDTGGPALRAMTFAARGAMILAASKAIHAHRDELLALSTASGGNTRGDAKFDVDGCTGTLAYYANLGAELGDTRVLLDGEMAPMMRAPRYVGRHVFTPRHGAAVHINAFNFPAWGMGEKMAVALLAGMPCVVKPASSTAPLSSRIAEILVAADVLPAGAFTYIAGGCGDLVERLGEQDVLAFTGSADTGAMLRGKPNVVARSVRVNVEADSLNAAVLGTDVATDSETFDLFLREVARDMTQKAGQKCTAIRRVFVPAGKAEEVGEALAEEVRRTRVGDPREKGVRMGPLATAAQLRDVRAGVDRLAAGGEFVLGDGGRGELVGVDGEKGYFMSPVLLRLTDPDKADVVHDHEVFGPVATIVPYGDAAEAVDGVRRGKGGLVSSVYSDDKDFVEEVVLGIAPYHGRLTIGSARVAEHSPGPGTVLPSLVHGGPGRAGGGEELGGLRGLRAYMQRTGVQGSKPLLQKIFPE